MAKTISVRSTKGKTVWLTFKFPYTYYPKNALSIWDCAIPKRATQRFAIEMVGEHFAKNSWLNNISREASINHCGKFSEDTIVLDLDGFVIRNENLLEKGYELQQFVNILKGGIQMGKERLTVNNY